MIAQMPPLRHIKALFSGNTEKQPISLSLKQYLDTACSQLSGQDDEDREVVFIEQLKILLQSDDSTIAGLTLHWVLDDFVRHHRLPESVQQNVFPLIRVYKAAWLAYPLLKWLASAADPYKKELYGWLSELDFEKPEQRITVIEPLLIYYLRSRMTDLPLFNALKRLDSQQGEVTDMLLFHFPAKTPEENQRIIHLLGQTGRYRIVRPLVTFAQEYPDYIRPVMKALVKLDYAEVDQFYLSCLENFPDNPMILMEAVKQVRKRRLRKAIPILEELFPLDETVSPLISRAVNGEIALTMASFGVYIWALEKLLPEMILGGVTQKYLAALDMLNVTEAIPLLKALMLLPETTEISALQQHAYRICERLLLSGRR
jgi:hypothetical protein